MLSYALAFFVWPALAIGILISLTALRGAPVAATRPTTFEVIEPPVVPVGDAVDARPQGTIRSKDDIHGLLWPHTFYDGRLAFTPLAAEEAESALMELTSVHGGYTRTDRNAVVSNNEEISWRITEQSSGNLAGMLSITVRDAISGNAELTLVTATPIPDAALWSAILVGALKVGFETYRLHRLFVRLPGTLSQYAKVLQRAGMRLEAHYREHTLFQGEWSEELHFALLDREWQRSKHVEADETRKTAG